MYLPTCISAELCARRASHRHTKPLGAEHTYSAAAAKRGGGAHAVFPVCCSVRACMEGSGGRWASHACGSDSRYHCHMHDCPTRRPLSGCRRATPPASLHRLHRPPRPSSLTTLPLHPPPPSRVSPSLPAGQHLRLRRLSESARRPPPSCPTSVHCCKRGPCAQRARGGFVVRGGVCPEAQMVGGRPLLAAPGTDGWCAQVVHGCAERMGGGVHRAVVRGCTARAFASCCVRCSDGLHVRAARCLLPRVYLAY